MKPAEIRERREILGLSQFEFSKLVGIERCRLSNLECGHLICKPEEADAIRRKTQAAAEKTIARIQQVIQIPAVA